MIVLENSTFEIRYFAGGLPTLIEKIASTTNDVVIDNGASSFVPLSHYLISNQVPALLKDLGHEMVIHTVITGGQALLDTINGFAQLIDQFENEAQFIVWLNPYWGAIEHDGKALTIESLPR
ncbi:traL protein [Legionella drozanskii LLAP-1]|uniref:TraL protein n=1 Tax=Legionella drozanskii LLAP-1 TaxID=1212489 RepID=A0A0W0SKU7_9GAMM|nr:traL protein [Legionella drozanskii LLAP-1]